MNKFLIIKTGGTFDELTATRLDFEDWTAQGMDLHADEWFAVDVRTGQALPDPSEVAGCVVTGSHDMVSEHAEWMELTADWIRRAIAAGLPLLGICFGHQLMADALGGRADYHPDGLEIGTVDIRLSAEAANDPLFSALPEVFPAHVTHSQSALALPTGAVLLAASDHEAHHAFRLGEHAWGVQFHPEFDAHAIRHYVRELAPTIVQQGGDPKAIADAVNETPISASILTRFVAYCRER